MHDDARGERGSSKERQVTAAKTISISILSSPNTRDEYINSMDSPLISQVFRRLLSHQTCSRLRFHPLIPRQSPLNALGRKYYRSSKEDDTDGDPQTSSWQQRSDIFPPDKLRDYERYPMVTADALRSRRERPRRVKMLARDFIEGDLPIDVHILR